MYISDYWKVGNLNFMYRVLKEATESACRTFAGREFQSFGPAYEMDFLKISS